MRAVLKAFLLLLALAVVVGGIGVSYFVSSGVSAKEQPGRVEEFLARNVRNMAIARRAKTLSNPVQYSAEVIADGRAHFADHCATCHANDGGGDTEIGRGLYPKVPDLRAAPTQSLTDGELFSIIEHGIRLSGMPGWGNGTPESERESWSLVHFIRRLPKLTPEEIERMEGLNPKTPAQWREEEEARRFLQGDAKDSPPQAPKKGHGHRD